MEDVRALTQRLEKESRVFRKSGREDEGGRDYPASRVTAAAQVTVGAEFGMPEMKLLAERRLRLRQHVPEQVLGDR